MSITKGITDKKFRWYFSKRFGTIHFSIALLIYHHPTFVQHKKNFINLFSLYCMKTNYIREKKKNQEKKNNLNLK
jgi:hypothetical protein